MLGNVSSLSFLNDRVLSSSVSDLSCRWCGESEDAIDHIMFNIRVMEEVWWLFFKWWRWLWIAQVHWRTFFVNVFIVFSGEVRSWWLVGCASII
ncbi:hypothetical protein GQ457_10G028080 [Hibiscus cannabinus]